MLFRSAAARADVLKAAHHGSEGSTLPDFLRAVDPTVLLLSNGSEARGLRMAERARDIPLYATDARGSITLTFGGEGSFSVSGFLAGDDSMRRHDDETDTAGAAAE